MRPPGTREKSGCMAGWELVPWTFLDVLFFLCVLVVFGGLGAGAWAMSLGLLWGFTPQKSDFCFLLGGVGAGALDVL